MRRRTRQDRRLADTSQPSTHGGDPQLPEPPPEVKRHAISPEHYDRTLLDTLAHR